MYRFQASIDRSHVMGNRFSFQAMIIMLMMPRERRKEGERATEEEEEASL